jgi:DNA polymerase-3 subunit delta'
MLTLNDILGQDAALSTLRNVVASERIPHAMLFHGPAGVGKATTALAFATAMICTDPGGQACGHCSSCQLFDSGNHPDLLHVGRLTKSEIKRDKSALITADREAEEGELGSQILVDQIRTLNGVIGLRPRQGRRRVFLIDPADQMNREAQNSLLKTLEEPPAHSSLILMASRPHHLLPTVRSRCFSVGFTTMRSEALTQALLARDIPQKEAAARAALSGGSFGDALALDIDQRLGRRKQIYEMLVALTGEVAAVAGLPAMAADLAGDDEATIIDGLDCMQSLLRDAARAGLDSPSALAHIDMAPQLQTLGRRLGIERSAELVRATERLRADLRFNANRTLIAETLLAAVAGGPLP